MLAQILPSYIQRIDLFTFLWPRQPAFFQTEVVEPEAPFRPLEDFHSISHSVLVLG